MAGLTALNCYGPMYGWKDAIIKGVYISQHSGGHSQSEDNSAPSLIGPSPPSPVAGTESMLASYFIEASRKTVR